MLGAASALPLLQARADWRELGALAGLGLALTAIAIATRSSRPLFWAALVLCSEELLGLVIAQRSASALTFAFAVLLFLGLESAYAASGSTYWRQPLRVYAKALLPLYAVAASTTLLLSLFPRASSLGGVWFVLLGLGAATAVVALLALLALHTRSRALG